MIDGLMISQSIAGYGNGPGYNPDPPCASHYHP